MSASLTFMGAARTVTGSKHLLEVGKKQILIDCGMFQGSRELRERNWRPFEFEPRELDAVVITHAHTDHIGLLPKLVREGYRGPIYATPGTIGICKFSLPDSGRLQEEEAKHHNKHGSSRHHPAEPLYTEADAYEVLKLLKPLGYDKQLELPGGCTLEFHPAGHILGSAWAHIYLPNGERLLMGGDLGRYDTPIIEDPAPAEYGEYLVLESTYGDRLHPNEKAGPQLAALIRRAYDEQLCLLVPSFAIGRTQELLYEINLLQKDPEFPRIPIYLDSPMAVSATDLYDKTVEDHDRDMKLLREDGDDPLHPEGTIMVRDRNQSKALNGNRGPMMVIAGSGMANGGRIQHHLMHRLHQPNTMVVFTGYQAHGTLGRTLLEGAETVRIFGNEIPVRAEVTRLTALSAHADQGEILRWLKTFKQAPKMTYLVHGEEEAQVALQAKIREELGWNVTIADYLQRVELS